MGDDVDTCGTRCLRRSRPDNWAGNALSLITHALSSIRAINLLSLDSATLEGSAIHEYCRTFGSSPTTASTFNVRGDVAVHTNGK